MSNKVTGAIFCGIAAILMSARYLSAAILVSAQHGWNADLFALGLKLVGYPILVASIISLIVGISFFAYEVYQEFKKRRSERP